MLSTMPAVYETMTFRAHWGFTRSEQQKAGKHTETGVIEPNWKSAEDELAGVMAEIEEGNWEIKSTVPLIASEYATHTTIHRQVEQSYGAGWGYGAAFTDGIIFLCQRRVEMTDEAFSTYETARKEREERRKIERIKAFTSEFPITEKRKLIGSTQFVFKGKDYPTRAAAEIDRDAAIARIR